MCLAPDCLCEPGGARLLLQGVLMVYAAGPFLSDDHSAGQPISQPGWCTQG